MMVTIYITNYNYADYIIDSIESVLNQEYQDFELLIIDDGSSDNSRDLIENYRDHEKVTIIYQKNKGLNITNNIALRMASGKYIMRLDADDFLEKQALSTMVGILEERTDVGLVFPDYYIVDKDGNRLEHIKRHDFDKDVSLYNAPAHGACTLIRVQYLKNLGGYNENYTCQDGYELWIKFISKYNVTNVGTPLFNYRRHSSNLTNNENKILQTRARIHQEHIDKSKRNLNTAVIIPIRKDGRINQLALSDLGEEKLIDYKIKAALDVQYATQIIVSSPDEEIEEYVLGKYSHNPKVSFHSRKRELARPNDNINESIEQIIKDYSSSLTNTKAIALLYIEYPFLKSQTITDAINALFLFDSDSLISIREDNRMLFQHTGNGLEPILDHGRFTKLERETLYQFCGGANVIKLESWKKYRKTLGGKIGHITIGNIESFLVGDETQLQIANGLLNTFFLNELKSQ